MDAASSSLPVSDSEDAVLLADFGYGDGGKGKTVDWLCRTRRIHTVVRFNGGPQAGHNVVTPEGLHHCFSQLGSGMFVPGVDTFLSRFMAVNPLNMFTEARHLHNLGVPFPLTRMRVDADCPVITPFQTAMNRLREIARGSQRHGSTGHGYGETIADMLVGSALRAGDLGDEAATTTALERIRDHKLSQLGPLQGDLKGNPAAREHLATFFDAELIGKYVNLAAQWARMVTIVDAEWLAKRVRDKGPAIVFEPAQGVLLDEDYGFHPHTTWSHCTFANADKLLSDINFRHGTSRLGVMRAFHTRHGAGPFVTEDSTLTERFPDPYNPAHEWQGGFRTGWLDLVALDYADAVVGGVDGMVVNHLDQLAEINEPRVCTLYRHADGSAMEHIDVVDAWDFEARETLTARLASVAPVYSIVPGGEETYLQLIEQTVGAPVILRGFGPRATDMRSIL